MSEFFPRVAAVFTAGAIGAALLSAEGCDSHTAGPAIPRQPSIPRCYDTPQPSEYVPIHQKPVPEPKIPSTRPGESIRAFNKRWKRFERQEKLWEQSLTHYDDPYELPPLHLTYYDKYVEDDPIYPEDQVDRATQSIVEISTKDWKGTGFLVKDSGGKQVVVTAAHVVGNATLSGLTIETDGGKKTHPTGGCYIYEDKGKFADLAKGGETPVDKDIAVLTLPSPLTKTDLSISKKPVRRGEWTLFVNYQADSEPGTAASYTGVVASGPTDQFGYHVLTGLSIKKTPVTVGAVETEDIQGGASGGPILDAHTGTVLGVSTSGNKDGIFEDTDTLRTLYNVQFTGNKHLDFKHGFAPIMAGAMSVRLITKAISAPNA